MAGYVDLTSSGCVFLTELIILKPTKQYFKPLKKSFMKLLSHLSIIRGIGYLLVFILCVNCKKDFNSTDPSQLSPGSITQPDGGNIVASASIMSQTRTASRLITYW